jgi:class 3 adenylate cyclase/pimeloyl-ACP methyl ester carboxylesterase
MSDVPEVRYAWNGDFSLAYQVFGDGPVDLLYVPGYCSHLDLAWESPYLARFLRGLGARARVIATDRRGWGLSERFSPDSVPPMEILVDDLVMVMDAARSSRAVVFASWECGIIAMLLAAAHPDRVAALVLCDTFPALVANEDTPSMIDRDGFRPITEEIRRSWGTLGSDPNKDPAVGTGHEGLPDDREREWMSRYERASVTPGALIAETWRAMELDARPVLSSIQAPTLVVGLEQGERMVDPSIARFLGERIPDARMFLVGKQSDEHDIAWLHWYGRGDAILREVSTLITEVRDRQADYDRVLATVLFTDIVGSTEKAAELGDHGWRELVEQHHATIRGLLARYRGVEIDTAGDGFFATFDGPARAVKCAAAILEAVRPLGIEVRAGVHTGEVDTIAGKVGGLAVIIGSRIAALAGPSEVVVSSTVKDLVAGSGLAFEDAGEHELKGVPDRWHLYQVVGPSS